MTTDRANIVRVFLEAGADMYIEDSFGETMLQRAEKRGRADVIEVMHTYGNAAPETTMAQSLSMGGPSSRKNRRRARRRRVVKRKRQR